MIDKKLFFRLVLPLSVLLVMGLLISRPINIKELALNLVVEIAGILITVSYVDWIIRERDAEKWKPTYSLIRSDYALEAMHFLSDTTLFLNDAGWKPPNSTDPNSQNKPLTIFVEHVSEKEIFDALLITSDDSLATLSSNVDARIESIQNLLNRYSTQLTAEDMNIILEYESSLKALLLDLFLISDKNYMVELSDDNNKEPKDIRLVYLRRSASNIKSVISQAILMVGEFFPLKGDGSDVKT